MFLLNKFNSIRNILIRKHSNMVFEGPIDRFKGINITLNDDICGHINNEQFSHMIKESLTSWKSNNIRVSWFKIPLKHAHYIPQLVNEGFVYHHAKSDFVMMYKWISDKEPDNVPSYAYTNIGVGGLVIDDNDRVLVVKEKYFFGDYPMWKFPGGCGVQGEDFGTIAEREVLEETGIKCKFESIVTFRHYHQFAFDCSDIYIVCHLKILNDEDNKTLEVKKCDREISDCKWIPIDELRPQLTKVNRFILDKFLENRKNGLKISIDIVDSQYKGIKPQTIYSIHTKL